MIAPIRNPEPEMVRSLRRARRAVAEAFLPEPSGSPATQPGCPAWQAWLVALWLVVVGAAWAAGQWPRLAQIVVNGF